MHAFLSTHDDIHMSPAKEPHYFSVDITREGDEFHGDKRFGVFRSLDQYLWLFRGATDESVVGEASPLYLYSKEAAAEIHRFDPDAKIIIMLREPISFLRSLHSQFLYYLDETCESLLEALDLEPGRRVGEKLPKSVRLPSLLYYSELGSFSTQIGRYTDLFPEQNVKVIVQDDLGARTPQVYRSVLEFLGVQADVEFPDLPTRKVNPSKRTRSRAVQAMLRDWRLALRGTLPMTDFPKGPDMRRKLWTRLLPARVQSRIVERITALNTKWTPLPPLPDDERRKLQSRFVDEVRRLSGILDRDLVELWGYEA